MMSLINELKEKSNKAYDVRQEVIEEIKEYFDKYLDSDRFENYLKKSIDKDEIAKRTTYLVVRFWEYHVDCSDTHFSCGGKIWYNPKKQSHTYKGVNLYDVQNDICKHLETKMIQRMRDLGFNYLGQNMSENRFKYFDSLYYFGW